MSKRYTQRIERHNLNLRQLWHGWDGSRCRVLKIGGAADRKSLRHYLNI
ncbi:IS1 family transposase [Enterobacter sp. CPE_E222]